MSERRELILQLGQMITDRIGHKVTIEDPEYWGLACIVTDEMAEVALKMKVRKPMTFEQMLKVTGKEEKKLQELLDEMSRVGNTTGRIQSGRSNMCFPCSCQAARNSLI